MYRTILSITAFISFFCFNFSTISYAQPSLFLPLSQELWHAQSVNPAFFPTDKKVAIGLPGLGVDFNHSANLGYSDFIKENGSKKVLNFTDAIAKLDDNNTILLQQRTETLQLGFRIRQWQLSLGHAIRTDARIVYPKVLPQMLWQGNAQFIGQTVNIAPEMGFQGYNEFSLGIGRAINEKINIGAKLKYYTGIGAAQSERHTMNVTTDDDIYQLTLQTDYSFLSADAISSIDTLGNGFKANLDDFGKKGLFSSNSGIGIDIGIQARINDKLTIAASVLDIAGTIKWAENAARHTSKGQYTYEGVVFPANAILSDTSNLSFDSKLDTLNDIFRFQKTAESFSSSIPMSGYLSGLYTYNAKMDFGAVFFYQKLYDETQIAFGASAAYKPFKMLQTAAMLSYNTNKAFNLGFKLAFQPGPVQFYAMSDNIIHAITPYSHGNVNFRVGLGLVFGKKKQVEQVQ